MLDRSKLPTRANYGVPEDRFVFCNFNQLYKMDPDIFSTWMAVLRRVPNAVLWLLRFPPAGEANIRAEARKRGVRDEQVDRGLVLTVPSVACLLTRVHVFSIGMSIELETHVYTIGVEAFYLS